MHKRELLQLGEPIVQSVLQRQLAREGFDLYTKVRLSDVIEAERNERLAEEDAGYLERAHLDFVVVEDNRAVFAVQFDDDTHEFDRGRRHLDAVKNRLCKAADLPLLRVTAIETEEHEQFTLLDYMMMRFVAWRDEYPDIKAEIEEYASQVDFDKADPADLAIDLDPAVHFDLRHPFPGTAIVRERLWRKHSIAWALDPPERRAQSKFVCDVSLCQMGNFEKDEFHTVVNSVTAWSTQESREVPVFESEVKVSIRSWLPLIPTVPGPFDVHGLMQLGNHEEALEMFKRRVESIWVPRLEGISAEDVAEHFCDYLGFRACERWVERLGVGQAG